MVIGGVDMQLIVDSLVIRAIINDKDLKPNKKVKRYTYKNIKK